MVCLISEQAPSIGDGLTALRATAGLDCPVVYAVAAAAAQLLTMGRVQLPRTADVQVRCPYQKTRLGEFSSSDEVLKAACSFDRTGTGRLFLRQGDWSSTVGVATVGGGLHPRLSRSKWLPRTVAGER